MLLLNQPCHFCCAAHVYNGHAGPSALNLPLFPTCRFVLIYLMEGSKENSFGRKEKQDDVKPKLHSSCTSVREQRYHINKDHFTNAFPQKTVSPAKEKRNRDRRKIILLALLLFLKHGEKSTFKTAWFNNRYLFLKELFLHGPYFYCYQNYMVSWTALSFTVSAL